jgi:8-amino-7-oxononanoate synthase
MLLGKVEPTALLADRLRNDGVLAGMVRPPTVPEGSSRLRFSLKTNMDLEAMAQRILQSLNLA